MAHTAAPKPEKKESSEEEYESGEEVEEEIEVEEEEEEEEEEAEEGEEEEEEEDDDEDGDEEEDEEDDESKPEEDEREAVRKLLEPFGRDQLIDLLKEAARADRSVVERIAAAADSDSIHRKIFVHGLGWDATIDTLRDAFRQYDEVEDCNVVTDRATGKSKGYGFVLLRTRVGAERALLQPQKKISNRLATCQLASTGPIQTNYVQDPTGRKIYVNNVGPNVDMEKLRKFFSQFGEIEEGPLGFDRATGKLRGFAVFVYKTMEGCRRALVEPTKTFEGCKLHCQRAVEASKLKSSPATPGLGAAAVLPPSDLALTASLMGLNPAAAALLGQNLGPVAGGLAGQSTGIPGLNSALGAAGLSGFANQNAGLGLGASTPVVNGIGSSAIGAYNSQLALHGLGAQQSSQLSQLSSMRSQSGLGSAGANLPHYLGSAGAKLSQYHLSR